MKRVKLNWAAAALLLGFAGLASGCDSGCYECEAEVAVVIEEEYGPVYRHSTAVFVRDVDGYSLGGAEVELVIAGVPEQRFIGITDEDGEVWFTFDAPADVVVMAYACAPEYECNAADIGTVAGGGYLAIQVVLPY